MKLHGPLQQSMAPASSGCHGHAEQHGWLRLSEQAESGIQVSPWTQHLQMVSHA